MARKKLIIENVSKVFTTARGQTIEALRHVNAYVEEGEFVTIVGTSGCGKSTLLRIVAGLEKPTSGRILLDGKEMHRPGADRGMVFQSYTLYEWLTVSDNISFGLRLRGVSRKEIREKTRFLIEKIGLSGFEDTYPKYLSGGMKQRVAIARAMANDPSILLLDEPFGALDAQTRTIMQELLLQLVEENRMTVLFVTHDIDEAIFLGDAVYVMSFRPGTIKEEVKIDVPHPRSPEVRTSPFFMDLKRSITAAIREETIRSIEASKADMRRTSPRVSGWLSRLRGRRIL